MKPSESWSTFPRACGIALTIVSTLAVGCSRGGGERGDTATPRGTAAAQPSVDSTRVASATAGPGGGQQGGSAGGASGGTCAAPSPSEKNPGVKADPRAPGDAAKIDAYLATLCFGLGDPDQNDESFPVKSGDVNEKDRLWFQTELRMLNTNPELIPSGSGMIVAKIRNETGRAVRLEFWTNPLPPNTDAYLWLGKKGSTLYSLVMLRRNVSGNIKVISRIGDWERNTAVHHQKPMGAWDPHKFDNSGKHILQRAGSGWVACSAGCCTARNANVPA